MVRPDRGRRGRRAHGGAPSSRSLLVGLVVSAARWRRSGSLAVLLAAATAVAAATLGPLWATATADALGSRQVREAPVVERELVMDVAANLPSGGVVTVPVVALNVSENAVRLGGPAGAALSPPRLLLASAGRLQVQSQVTPDEKRLGVAVLAWLEGACSRLPLLDGACADGALVSDRTARSLGLRVGSRLDVPELAREPERPGSGRPFVRTLRVTGIYGTGSPEQEHWESTQLFSVGPAREVDGEVLPERLDAVLVGRVLMEALSQTPVNGSARRSLLAEPRTAPELAAIEAGLRAHIEELEAEGGDVRIRDEALDLLEDVSLQAEAARRVALVLGAQLLLLACCVLGLVVAGSADARAPDVALGRLRGLRRRALVAFCAAEPLLLLVLAVPLGVLAGASGALLLAAAALPEVPALRPDLALLAALGAAVLAAVVAVLVGVRLVLSRGVLTPAADTGSGSGRLVLDAVLVTAAIAAIAALVPVASGGGPGTGLLAPLLGALAAGVLLARLGRVLARLRLTGTARGGGVAAFLAVRRTARLSGGVRTVVLVAAALSCATYAAAVLAVTDEQRAAQAAMQVGAEAVYRVEPVEVPKLLAAVEAADPDGQQLMATMTGTRDDRPDDTRLLGVDSRRLAAVAAWRDEWTGRPPAELARELRPEVAPPLLLAGRRVTLDLRADVISGRGAVVVLRLVNPRGNPVVVRLGELAGGDSRLTAELRGCDGGCRVAQLVLLRRARTGDLIGTLSLRALEVDGRPVAGLADPAGWRAAPVDETDPLSESMRLEARAGSLELVYAQASAEEVGIARADVPRALPALLAGDTAPRLVGQAGLVEISVPGPRSQDLLASVVGRGQVLPRLTDEGQLVDLSLLQRAAPADVRATRQEVWSNRPADAATRTALEAAGLRVLGVTTRAQVEQDLSERGPARVLALLPVVALVALGLAVLGQAAEALAAARPRAVEAAALQAVGVPRTALHRAALQESVVLLLLGALAGVVAGVLTADLTSARIGVVGLEGVRAPFPEGLPWVPLVLTVLVAGAVLAAVAAACATTGLRRGDSRLLRQEAA
jgi:hypothetical protein